MSLREEGAVLVIDGESFDEFKSYKCSCDVFAPADEFTMTLNTKGKRLARGAVVKLYINDQLELVGKVLKIHKKRDAKSEELTVTGRNLMGLIEQHYVKAYPDNQNVSLKSFASALLAEVPYINRKDVVFGKGNKLREVALTKTPEDFEFAQVKPGETVFEALNRYARMRGMFFFAMPDGKFIFGQPKTTGEAEFDFIYDLRDPGRNNIEDLEFEDDISEQYSEINVIGQNSSADAEGAAANFSAVLKDEDFPFTKPLVVTVDEDGKDPAAYARMLRDKQRLKWSLTYKVKGHSQGGKNYQPNSIVYVKDDDPDVAVDGKFYMHGREFSMSESGVYTTVKITQLGALPA